MYILTNNPTTITSPVPGEVYGEPGVAWTVTNLSTIEDGRDGILLESGGDVINGGPSIPNTLIYGNDAGVEIRGAAGTVTNFGTIRSTVGVGVDLDGGTVINGASGETGETIAGEYGIRTDGSVGTVTNFGTITGGAFVHDVGVQLGAGGVVTNGDASTTSALIADYGDPVIKALNGAATVTNFGTVLGDHFDPCIALYDGGVVTNGAINSTTAVIGSYYPSSSPSLPSSDGVYVSEAAGTVTNFGTIGELAGRVSLEWGLDLEEGGRVTNGATDSTEALITGYGAVKITGSAGTVTNFGTMLGSANTLYAISTNGVYLGMGGRVSNGSAASTTASITGRTGVLIAGALGTVINFGAISSGPDQYAVYLKAGGVITNGGAGVTSATITGGENGVRIAGAAGTVSNFGTIASGPTGVYSPTGLAMTAGGTVTNGNSSTASASISGGDTGIDISGAAGTVRNFGTIVGQYKYGVYLEAGGSVTNGGGGATDASISGYIGIRANAAGGAVTVTNFGTITGADGTAAMFGNANDRLVIMPGAKFLAVSGQTGIVNGGSGTNTIELAGTSLGIFSGLRAQFVDFSTVTVAAGADWQVDLTPASLAGEKITGAGGSDQLVLTSPGTFSLGKVSGFPTVRVANIGPTTLTFTKANFTGVPGKVIAFDGGNGGNTIIASLPSGDRLVLKGGNGSDLFKLSATTLADSSVAGGAGLDILDVTSAGTITVTGVSGVEEIVLGSRAANSLTLTDANFADVKNNTITVKGGSGGNTIDASGLTGSHKAVLDGGAGADVLIAGRHETMTGGAGADTFEFTTPGTLTAPDTNVITDFAHSTDKIAFSDAGFSLGLAGASSTPTALPSTLFVSNATGAFTSADQRFAYDTATGQLFYDAHGNHAGSSAHLVATLNGEPTLTASDLFFVS